MNAQANYQAEIEEFAENEDCSPVEEVAANPACIEIGRRFGKTPEEVAADINRHYLNSYRN